MAIYFDCQTVFACGYLIFLFFAVIYRKELRVYFLKDGSDRIIIPYWDFNFYRNKMVVNKVISFMNELMVQFSRSNIIDILTLNKFYILYLYKKLLSVVFFCDVLIKNCDFIYEVTKIRLLPTIILYSTRIISHVVSTMI